MTKIEASTQSILAAIAAKNAWQTSTTHKTPVTYDVTASENPFPCNESSPKQPLQVKPQKTPKNKSEKSAQSPTSLGSLQKTGRFRFGFKFVELKQEKNTVRQKLSRTSPMRKSGATKYSLKSV